jgi:hypothetical protein
MKVVGFAKGIALGLLAFPALPILFARSVAEQVQFK